jgi:hypothetical protein
MHGTRYRPVTGQNFPAVSLVTGLDFHAGSVVTGLDFHAGSVVTGLDFPAGSVVTGLDFPTGSVVTGLDFPAGSVVTGLDFPAGSVVPGLDFPAGSVVTGLDFPARSVVTGLDFPSGSVVSSQDFPAVTFLALGIEKTLWVLGKLFRYQRVGFSVLNNGIFSDGKLKKAFLQCTQGQNSRTPMRLPPVWRKQGIIPEMDHRCLQCSVQRPGCPSPLLIP